MTPRANRDVVSGVVLTAFGIFFAGYAATQLPLGSFRMMGSGMFPFLAGLVLSAVGATMVSLTLAKGLDAAPKSDDEVEKPQWLSLAVVIASVAAFALVIRPLGVAPAIFALVLVASLASAKLTVPTALALAGALSVVAWTIFIFALGLPLRFVAWPL